MPVRADAADLRYLHTILHGRITDDELVGYYHPTPARAFGPPWREVVDGRDVTDMAVTPEGQARLAAFVASHADEMRGGRVAMVATSPVTYGMFRMWEMSRASLPYDVRVFREIGPAVDWVCAGDPPVMPGPVA